MRTNLFFLFHSSLIWGNNAPIYGICEYFQHLTFDIIEGLENISSEFSKKESGISIPENEYYIWALYDIFSTMFDFFLSFYDVFTKQNGIDNFTLDITKNSTLVSCNY
jgi:hypothetical protein